MHLKRLVVAAVSLPLIYLYIMYLPIEYYLALLFIVCLLAMSEFYSMYHVKGILKYASIFFGVIILCVSYFSEDFMLDIIILSVMVIVSIRLVTKRSPSSSLNDISPPIFGLLYIPGLFIFQTYIRKIGPEWIIFLYMTVWSADSMAYYVGKSIGKRKLYKEVSPNKTVAGMVGSLFGGVLGAMLFKIALFPLLAVSSAVLIGITIGIISVIGDLIESMFKRDAGVKDSGLLIPGHGGILDKIDGALFAGPVFYWFLILAGMTK